MSTIKVPFRYELDASGTPKRVKCKPVILNVDRVYLNGNVRTESGDVFRAKLTNPEKSQYLAVA